MGDPALQLGPAEEVAAEQAAQQTTRLVVIEGGKSAAAGAGETVAGETAAEGLLAGAGATLAAIGVALLILLWPSDIAPEPRISPPATAGPAPVPVPDPPPVTECPPQPCDPCPPPPPPQVHRDHPHGECQDHWHYFVYNQNPKTCQCFLQRKFGGCLGPDEEPPVSWQK